MAQIGELQCYDRRALASLAQAAQDKGRPEWGYTGPHDAGTYTSNPEVTRFPLFVPAPSRPPLFQPSYAAPPATV